MPPPGLPCGSLISNNKQHDSVHYPASPSSALAAPSSQTGHRQNRRFRTVITAERGPYPCVAGPTTVRSYVVIGEARYGREGRRRVLLSPRGDTGVDGCVRVVCKDTSGHEGECGYGGSPQDLCEEDTRRISRRKTGHTYVSGRVSEHN